MQRLCGVSNRMQGTGGYIISVFCALTYSFQITYNQYSLNDKNTKGSAFEISRNPDAVCGAEIVQKEYSVQPQAGIDGNEFGGIYCLNEIPSKYYFILY